MNKFGISYFFTYNIKTEEILYQTGENFDGNDFIVYENLALGDIFRGMVSENKETIYINIHDRPFKDNDKMALIFKAKEAIEKKFNLNIKEIFEPGKKIYG